MYNALYIYIYIYIYIYTHAHIHIYTHTHIYIIYIIYIVYNRNTTQVEGWIKEKAVARRKNSDVPAFIYPYALGNRYYDVTTPLL